MFCTDLIRDLTAKQAFGVTLALGEKTRGQGTLSQRNDTGPQNPGERRQETHLLPKSLHCEKFQSSCTRTSVWNAANDRRGATERKKSGPDLRDRNTSRDSCIHEYSRDCAAENSARLIAAAKSPRANPQLILGPMQGIGSWQERCRLLHFKLRYRAQYLWNLPPYITPRRCIPSGSLSKQLHLSL
jgi:hypothetical protein